LYLKGKATDVWRIRELLYRVPPIVFLSACDTHAADRNHATTANGFLSLGARTVLASVFPLDARLAAIFAARLLYRISEFVPLAIDLFNQALTWSEVVTGMLRMQLLTDYLRQVEARGHIDIEAYKEIHYRGNAAINGADFKPFEVVDTLLLERGLERKTLRSIREMTVANSAVISYLQLGRPETILIDNPDRLAGQLQEFESI
jgi:hypothetical protein